MPETADLRSHSRLKTIKTQQVTATAWPLRAYRAKQKALIDAGDYATAQKMDMDDLQDKFGNKYNEGIDQAVRFSRKRGYAK